MSTQCSIQSTNSITSDQPEEEEQWIEMAHEIVEEEFDRGYAGMLPELEKPEAASVCPI